MSATTTETTTPVSTADQPSHALSNILAHNGSTWGGVGIVILTVGTAIHAQSLPTTVPEWVTFLGSLAVAVMAALGK